MNILMLGMYREEEILTGPQKFAARLSHLLARTESVTLVTYFFDGTLYGLWQKIFGREEVVTEGVLTVRRMGIARVFFDVLQHPYDIIHIVTFERFVIAALFANLVRRRKVVYTVHGIQAIEYKRYQAGYSLRQKWLDLILEKILFTTADALTFVSGIQASLAEQMQREDGTISIIAPGTDNLFLAADEIQRPVGPLRIVFSGAITRKEKGFSFFMEAVNAAGIPLELFVISPMRDKRPVRKGVTVSWFDPMPSERLAALYKEIDIFALTSEYDTFSIGTMEAMASGLAPVVTTASGISELIEDGVNGKTVRFGDVDRLAGILNELDRDRAQLHALQRRAAETAGEFPWERTAEQYRSLFLRLTMGRP